MVFGIFNFLPLFWKKRALKGLENQKETVNHVIVASVLVKKFNPSSFSEFMLQFFVTEMVAYMRGGMMAR